MGFEESKKCKLELVSLIVLIGFLLATFYHYLMGTYLGMSSPYNTFLCNPSISFTDFYEVLDLVPNLNPYYENYGWWANYFPLTYFLFYFFLMFKNKVVALVVFETIFVLLYIWFITREVRYKVSSIDLKAVIILAFMTYPFLYLLDRGNVEGYLFIFIALFFYFYQQDRIYLSLIFISIAIAMKLYPAVFIVLLISDKKYKEIVIIFFLLFLLFFIPLMLFEGSILKNMIGLKEGMLWFMAIFDKGNLGLIYNNSLYGCFKSSIALLNDGKCSTTDFRLIYLLFALITFTGASFFIVFRQPSFWKKSTIMVIAMILLPYVSFDYKLIFLMIPLFLFINSTEDLQSRFIKFYAVLFAMLLIPKNYFFYTIDPIFYAIDSISISISCYINPLLMITMIGCIVYESCKNGKQLC